MHFVFILEVEAAQKADPSVQGEAAAASNPNPDPKDVQVRPDDSFTHAMQIISLLFKEDSKLSLNALFTMPYID